MAALRTLGFLLAIGAAACSAPTPTIDLGPDLPPAGDMDPGCSICSANADCVGAGSALSCTCKAGFTGNGRTCTACATCVAGQYETAACTATTDTQCAACTAIPDCATVTCTTATDQVCGACSANFYLNQDDCFPCTVCPEGKFASSACSATEDTFCANCEANCNTCTAAGPGACTACAAGYFGASCDVCEANCATCTAAGPGACTTCNAGYFVTAGTCAACETNCDACTAAGPGACTTCSSGYFLSAGTCVGCEANCATCTAAGPGACTTCNPGYFRNAGNTCDVCAANCTTCTGGGANECTGCAAGYKLVAGACEPALTLVVNGFTSGRFEYSPRNKDKSYGNTIPNGECTGLGCVVVPTEGTEGVRLRQPHGLARNALWATFTGCDKIDKHKHCMLDQSALPRTVTAEVVEASVTLAVTGDTTGTFDYLPNLRRRGGLNYTYPAQGTCSGTGCTFTPLLGVKGILIRPSSVGVTDWSGCDTVNYLNMCELTDFATARSVSATVTAHGGVTLTVTGNTTGTFEYTIAKPRIEHYYADPQPALGTCSGAGPCAIALPNVATKILIRPSTAGLTTWTGCAKVSRSNACELDPDALAGAAPNPIAVTADVTAVTVNLAVTGNTTGTFEYRAGTGKLSPAVQGTCTGAACTFMPHGTKKILVRPSSVGRTVWTTCPRVNRYGDCEIALSDFTGAPVPNVFDIAAQVDDVTLQLDVSGDQTGTFGYQPKKGKWSRNAPVVGTCTGAGCTTPVAVAVGQRGLRVIPPFDKTVSWDSGCDNVNKGHCYITSSFPATVAATVSAGVSVTLNVTGDQTGTFEYLRYSRRGRDNTAVGTCTGAGCTFAVNPAVSIRIRPPAGKTVRWLGCSRVSARKNQCKIDPTIADGRTITAHVE